MPPEPGPGETGHGKLTEKQRFILAERTQESGGDYTVVNPNSGALGAYQVMPANLPGWLKASHQKQMSGYDYLHCRKCQDKLAWVILGGYYDRYGPRGAAAMWYSGQPNPNATYGDPPVYQYVNDVITLMGRGSFPASSGGAAGEPGYYTLPPPNEGDWSGHVRRAAQAHRAAAKKLDDRTRELSRIR
jgi:hypothetical protein